MSNGFFFLLLRKKKSLLFWENINFIGFKYQTAYKSIHPESALCCFRDDLMFKRLFALTTKQTEKKVEKWTEKKLFTWTINMNRILSVIEKSKFRRIRYVICARRA